MAKKKKTRNRFPDSNTQTGDEVCKYVTNGHPKTVQSTNDRLVVHSTIICITTPLVFVPRNSNKLGPAGYLEIPLNMVGMKLIQHPQSCVCVNFLFCCVHAVCVYYFVFVLIADFPAFLLLFVLTFGCLRLLLCDAAFFAVFVLIVVGRWI